MSQLNVYVPDDLEQEIRKRAKQEKESLSKYLANFLRREIQRKKDWDPEFFTKIVGGWEGSFPLIERHPPEEREDL